MVAAQDGQQKVVHGGDHAGDRYFAHSGGGNFLDSQQRTLQVVEHGARLARELSPDRRQADEPRRSLEERYKDHDGYVKEVTKAARKLEKQRLLPPADVQRYIDAAQASNVLQ